MGSNVVAYGEAPLAHTVSGAQSALEVEPDGDRGKDWPFALTTVFVPVVVAYAGAAYVAYAVASSLL